MLADAIQDAVDSGDYFDAIALLRAELATGSDAQAMYRLALNLQRVGRVDEALDWFDEAAGAGLIEPMLSINRGHAYKALGQADLAEAQYRAGLDYGARVSAIAYWSLCDLGSHVLTDQDVQAISDLLASAEPTSPYRSLFHFARGNALDHRKAYSAAFADFTKANSIVTEVRPYRADLYHKLVSELLSITSPETAEDRTFAPIFIIGMPRSGTTLVEQILSAHSQVGATDELVKLGQLSVALEGQGGYAEFLKNAKKEAFSPLAERYESTISAYDQNHGRLIDKNPGNFLHVALIKRLFPRAKIINVVRDPLDNAMGVYRRYFDKGYEFSYSMEGIIFHWQGYLTLMNHWNTLFKNEIFHLNYAALVKSPKDQIDTLLKYCELTREPQCYRADRTKTAVLTPSAIQVRQPISSKHLGSGRHYQNELATEIPQLVQVKRKADEIFGF